MEASSTTLNISPSTTEPETPKKHSHGANFGRYVEGCQMCAYNYPEGKDGPRRMDNRTAKRKAKREAEAPTGLTQEQVLAMIAQVVSRQPTPVIVESTPQVAPVMTMEQVLAMIRELKAPDPEEAEKKADQKKREAEARKQMLEVAQVEEQQKALRESNCDHKKQNGRTAIFGQAHSDGMYHPVCLHCFKEFTPVPLTRDQMQMGVS